MTPRSIVSPGSILDFLTAQQFREGSRSIQSFAPLAMWDARSLFLAGTIVKWHGGDWLAVTDSLNSEPISGNADWTLVGGTPYVDVLIDPVTITTAPFLDVAQTGPGLVILPAPGLGAYLYGVGLVSDTSDGDVWSAASITQLAYTNTAGSALPSSLATVQDNLDGFGVSSNIVESTGDPVPFPANPTTFLNQPVVAFTNEAITGGTRSLSFRLFYQIRKIPAFSSFFTITAVDQGAKTFTVNGDASALGATFSVVGSTGNNRTFTKVSATFGGVATDIVVAQAIPSATADGWVKT